MTGLAPQDDEVEVSIFSSTSSGEGIAVHLGYKNWVIIDSCKDSLGRIMPLEYLNLIKADLANVSSIVATHWHDDHIKGISKTLEECPNATFFVSSALKVKEFLALQNLPKHLYSKNSGIKEIFKVQEILSLRGKTPNFAVTDQSLAVVNLNNHSSGVWDILSLSPSSKAIYLSHIEIASLLESLGSSGQTIVGRSPNEYSIVTLFNFDDIGIILLGADLEEKNDKDTGWSAILNSNTLKRRRCNIRVFKIPHHGSETSYHKDFWDKHLGRDVKGLVTPYGRGRKKLPSKDDTIRILQHLDEVYITSDLKPYKRDKNSMKVFQKLKIKPILKEGTITHVRFRSKLNDLNKWEVNLSSHAQRLR